MTITHVDLDSQLRSLVVAVLGVLRSRPREHDQRLRSLFWNAYNEIRALPVHTSTQALIQTQPGIIEDALVRGSGADSPDGLANLSSMFLSRYLLNAINEDLTANEPAITTMIAEAYAFLAEGRRQVRMRLFLKGLSTAHILKVNSLIVRPIEQAERVELHSLLETWIGEFRASTLVDGDVIVIDQRVTGSAAELASVDMRRNGEALISYLRIHVDSSIVVIYGIGDGGLLWPSIGGPQIDAIGRVGLEQHQLPANALDRWETERNIFLTPPPALRIALKRFEMLTDYGNPDRILDQTIILEALFSDDDKQELAHKLSLRVANFVGSDPTERIRLYDTMRDGYTARSKLSHGRELPPRLRGIDNRISEILRLALSRYLLYAERTNLRNNKDEQAFIRKLDEMCLGGQPLL